MSRELPIFPLPLVLFPGTSQPLHIFEPRYRNLLADCLAGDRRFGIAFQPDAIDAPAPAPGTVGCVALIKTAQVLPDGRSDILTEGERRFTMVEWLDRPLLYRVALIDEFDDEADMGGTEAAEAEALAADVRRDFERLAAALSVLTDREEPEVELSSVPEQLSFQVAAALELEPEAKQALLATRSTTGRLRRLAALLAPLSADAEGRAVVRQRARGNGKGGAHPQIEPAS
jgi:ATP-dependent Lon protease